MGEVWIWAQWGEWVRGIPIGATYDVMGDDELGIQQWLHGGFFTPPPGFSIFNPDREYERIDSVLILDDGREIYRTSVVLGHRPKYTGPYPRFRLVDGVEVLQPVQQLPPTGRNDPSASPTSPALRSLKVKVVALPTLRIPRTSPAMHRLLQRCPSSSARR